MRKSVDSYDYLDSCSKFIDRSLPSNSESFSNLNGTGISLENVENAEAVCKGIKIVIFIANISDMSEYDDFYFKVDVVILANVF